MKRWSFAVVLLALASLGAAPIYQAAPPKPSISRSVGATRSGLISVLSFHARHHLVARDRFGNVKWTRDATNLVTRTGCSQLLTQTFKTQTAPVWSVGIIKSSPTFSTADTMGSHAGWTEEASGSTDISDATRPALTLGAVTATSDNVNADNSGSPAVFNIVNTFTVYGAYITSNATVGGTTGNLYGEATFTAAPVASGYTLTDTITMSSAAG